MILFQKRIVNGGLKYYSSFYKNDNIWKTIRFQTTKPFGDGSESIIKTTSPLSDISPTDRIQTDILPSARIFPLVTDKKEPTVLPFDNVPGPKAFKYLSSCRYYLSEFGTQMAAGFLIFILNINTYINKNKPIRNLSTLFDDYGPVVRFVNPVGADIVLLNHPVHIQKVFSMEGDYPVRSALESLQKYREERKSHVYGGLYTEHSLETNRRPALESPSNLEFIKQTKGLIEVCDNFTQKIYNLRNYQDEIAVDLQKEILKWAYDSLGLLFFAKKFSMLQTDLVISQCDVSWMYHSLVQATDAILQCEAGMHMWKLFTTPAWYRLVKHCNCLDSLIGKHVLEIEQAMAKDTYDSSSLTSAILLSDKSFKTEDIAGIVMDMMLIGVNTVSSAMSFLLYNLAKHQKVQRMLYKEIDNLCLDQNSEEIDQIRGNTPYLQACIKETLRLAPPIPLITRVLPRNIILDRYNIPRGTMIIMSTQDASLKETNFDDATKFNPERWLQADAKEYHSFASIPFGFGVRKCFGQNIAETMLSLLAIRVLHRYKLEYHYGDVQPTRHFIAQPNKKLKIRFIDRM